MKKLWLLLGILILPTESAAALELTRNLVSAGGIDCGAGVIRISGSLGGFAFGAGTAAPEILVIEGFWFPGIPSSSGVEDVVLTHHPFGLEQSFPNPCRSRTSIGYSVPGRGDEQVPIRIEIFDVQGRQIATLANASVAPGQYTTEWTGQSAAGQTVPAGVYYCRLRAGRTTAIKSLVVLK